ncbi:MAG: hypothetical protein KDD22_00370, partial [Bdellovibrionales bacterium]|nr:hypothetical protein [Bdellovibrionales bacterium]
MSTLTLDEECLSPSDAADLFKEAKVDVQSFPEPYGCPSLLSKLALTLKTLKNLKVQIPNDNPNEILEDLKKPWSFLIHSYKVLKYSYSPVAYAVRSMSGDDVLGISDSLFDESLPISLSILIHEASHGRAEDPGHTRCFRGQLERAEGACDMGFEIERSKAGAYSYQVWFLWLLAHSEGEFSLSDRAALQREYLELSTHRFNLTYRRTILGETLLVLNRHGEVEVFDPLQKKFLKIRREFLDPSSVKSLDSNALDLGAQILLTNGSVTTWSPLKSTWSWFDRFQIPSQVGPIDWMTRFFDFDLGVPRFLAHDRNGFWWHEDANPKNLSQRTFLPYEHPEELKSFRQTATLSGPKGVYLTSDRQLFLKEKAEQYLVDLINLKMPIESISTDPAGWNLFAIASDGRIYSGSSKRSSSISGNSSG